MVLTLALLMLISACGLSPLPGIGFPEPYSEKPFRLTVTNRLEQPVKVTVTHLSRKDYSDVVAGRSVATLVLGTVDGRRMPRGSSRREVLIRANLDDGTLVYCKLYFLGELELEGDAIEVSERQASCDRYANAFLNRE